MGLKSYPLKGGWVFRPTGSLAADPQLFVEEGTIYGVKYQIVSFQNSWINWGEWPEWEQMFQWCEHAFGATPEDGFWTPGERWYANDRKFWFKNPEDLSLFLLRWQ